MKRRYTAKSQLERKALLWLLCLGVAACATPPPPAPTPGPGFRIVALGDSYASGQGAPDEDFTCWKFWSTPKWNDKRCNRSLNAPTAKAAEILRQQGHTIDYLSYACSGAKIEQGLIGTYDGSEPPSGPHTPLPPQVDELENLASTAGVDAVTISIGGNDILFQYIVGACVLSPACNLSQPVIAQRLAQLPGRLDDLAQDLVSVSVDSHRIFVVEYPNPAEGSDGSYCDREPPGDLLSGIDANEARWTAEFVLPRLNRALCEAAQRHGWTYVGDVAPRFATHGWCAQPQNWLNTFEDSTRKQRHYRGAMHPNRDGHAAVGERLADAIAPLLAGQTPTSDACPVIPAAPPPP
jgi:lysophospholipase L1-like esterase